MPDDVLLFRYSALTFNGHRIHYDRKYVTEVEGYPGHPLPSLPELVELHERLSLPIRPATVASIAMNTRFLDEEEALEAIASAEAETGLPVDDPVRFGAEKLLRTLVPAGG